MPRYIIRTNLGYGNNYEVANAKDNDAADQVAYEIWREQAESNADYEVIEYTQENCEDYDLEFEE